jgi:hypothetical protein
MLIYQRVYIPILLYLLLLELSHVWRFHGKSPSRIHGPHKRQARGNGRCLIRGDFMSFSEDLMGIQWTLPFGKLTEVWKSHEITISNR